MLTFVSVYSFNATYVRVGSQYVVQYREEFDVYNGDHVLQRSSHGRWQSKTHGNVKDAAKHLEALRAYQAITHTHKITDPIDGAVIFSNIDQSPWFCRQVIF